MLNVISMRQMIASARKMPNDIGLITKMALFERCCNSKSVSLYTIQLTVHQMVNLKY